MLVGAKEVKDTNGNSYITFDIQGTPEELERVYRKESVEIEIDNGQDDRYDLSVEEEYEDFMEEMESEIDNIDADDLWEDDLK